MTPGRPFALVLGLAACGLSEKPWHATPEQLAPIPAPNPPVERTIGPLAIHDRSAETAWGDVGVARDLTEHHYLDRERIHAETTAFLGVVDTFLQPHAPETTIGFEQAHRELATLERLAPYSLYSVTLAFQQSTERLPICVHGAGVTWPCDRQLVPHVRGARPLFELGEAGPGIATLALHDLGNADDPGWRAFADATRTLARARGLVIDLRDAAGADPRALMPWIDELSGGRARAPLRAIERPAGADRYTAAYRARFTDAGRDPAIWATLVGGGAARTPAPVPARPIEIVVGRSCESACELVTRMLETYAGAVVIGGVGRSGRLARDEPALLVLPHSQTAVYFHATRYVLAAEIEAATGPTEAWHVAGVDPFDAPPATARYPMVDHATFAVREVAQRLAHGGWPRCDSFPAPTTATDTAKLHVMMLSTCGARDAGIAVETDVPASALRRYLATCPRPIETSSYVPGRHELRFRTAPTPGLLAQIAASELVRSVEVVCRGETHLD